MQLPLIPPPLCLQMTAFAVVVADTHVCVKAKEESLCCQCHWETHGETWCTSGAAATAEKRGEERVRVHFSIKFYGLVYDSVSSSNPILYFVPVLCFSAFTLSLPGIFLPHVVLVYVSLCV